MRKTVICKMNPAPQVLDTLDKTMRLFADACNDILDIAIKNNTSNKVKLQHLCYREIKERYRLPANLVIRAIARVAEAIKKKKRKRRGKSVKVKCFNPTSVSYDRRIFDFRESEEQVSISTIDGRK